MKATKGPYLYTLTMDPLTFVGTVIGIEEVLSEPKWIYLFEKYLKTNFEL